LARIAEEVGYDSEAAFNRAFKRHFGVPPATWRKEASASRKVDSSSPTPLRLRERDVQLFNALM
jgi:AraC-like DNA-binding protein